MSKLTTFPSPHFQEALGWKRSLREYISLNSDKVKGRSCGYCKHRNMRLTYLQSLCNRFPRGRHSSVRDLQLGRADSRTNAPCHSTNSTCHRAIVALLRAGGKAKSREFNQLFRSFSDTPTW